MERSGSTQFDLEDSFSSDSTSERRPGSQLRSAASFGPESLENLPDADDSALNSLTMSVVQSYNNPIFKQLMEAIRNGYIETAKDAIDTMDKSELSLGHALVFAVECGTGEIVGKLSHLPGVENSLPRVLVLMQSSEASKRNWQRGTNREEVYKSIVDVIAKNKSFNIDEMAKEKLNIALEYMIAKWEDHAFSLLKNPNVVKYLDCSKLLSRSIDIDTKNSKVAKVLIELGANNIIDSLILIQSYTGAAHMRTRYNWSESNGQEEVRAALVSALANRKTEFCSDELRKVHTILLCMIKSQNNTRVSELQKLFFYNPHLALQCEVDYLITEALNTKNGQAVEVLVKCRAKKLPTHLVWLQENYSILPAVPGIYRPWQSGSWETTHATIVQVLAQNWDLAFSAEEKTYPLFITYTSTAVPLDNTQKSALVTALKYMIVNHPLQAELLCGGGQQSAVRQLSGFDRCNLVEFSLVNNKITIARRLVHNGDPSLVDCLEDKSDSTFLYTRLMDDILAKPAMFDEAQYKNKILDLLEIIIKKGEPQVNILDQLLERIEVQENLSREERLELFKIALLNNQLRAARRLLERQPIGTRLRALFKIQTDDAIPIKDKLKGDRQFYQEMVEQTIVSNYSFASFAPDDQQFLTKVLECFIWDKEENIVAWLHLEHVSARISYSHMLAYAVKVANVSVVKNLSTLISDKITFRDIVLAFSQAVSVLMVEHAEKENFVAVHKILSERFLALAWSMKDLVLGMQMLSNTVEANLEATNDANNDLLSMISSLKPSIKATINQQSRDPMFELLEHLVIGQHFYVFDFCLQRLPNLMHSDVKALLKLSLTNHKFKAVLSLVDRAKDEIYQVISHLQFLCVSTVEEQAQNELQMHLRHLYLKLPVFLEQADHSEELAAKLRNVIRKIDYQTLEEDILVSLFSSKKLVDCIVSEQAHTYIEGQSLLALILEKCSNSLKNKAYLLLLSQTKAVPPSMTYHPRLISQGFLTAVNSDDAELVEFCLKHLSFDDLGISDTGADSPLYQAAQSQSYKVMALLLNLIEKGQKQEYKGALELETPKQGIYFQWNAKRLDPVLFAKLEEKVKKDSSQSFSVNY